MILFLAIIFLRFARDCNFRFVTDRYSDKNLADQNAKTKMVSVKKCYTVQNEVGQLVEKKNDD